MNLFALGEERLGRLSEERFYFILVVVLTAIVAYLATLAAIDLNHNFITIACDTATFQSAVVNTLGGRWFRDTAYNGPNYLGLHNTPALLLIAPLYAIYPSVDLLFTLQVWGVWIAVIPLYLLGLEILRKPLLAFLVAATALASPLFLHMSMAPVHAESFILAPVLWSYVFYRRGRWTGFWVSLVLALSCGEQAGLIYLALSAIWLLRDDGLPWRKRYGWFAFTTGLAWFVLSVTVISPLMHGPTQLNVAAYHYPNWGVDSLVGLAWAAMHKPSQALELLFSPARWLHLLGFIGLPLILAVFSLRALILMTPLAVYFLMCDQEFYLPFHAYYFQFAFLAAYLGLLFTLSRLPNPGRLAFLVLGATLFFNLLLLIPASFAYVPLDANEDEDFNATLLQVFSAIPRAAGVYSPHRYSAYLSNRTDMVMGDLKEANVDFDAMIDDLNANTTVHSQDIDFIVCDVRNDQCGPRLSGYDPAQARIRADNLTRLVKSGAWRIAWNQQDVVILQRTYK